MKDPLRFLLITDITIHMFDISERPYINKFLGINVYTQINITLNNIFGKNIIYTKDALH